jgi:hypothetical protein
MGSPGCLSRRLHGRQQKGDQDSDDRDDHQQLDQGKTRFEPSTHTTTSNSRKTDEAISRNLEERQNATKPVVILAGRLRHVKSFAGRTSSVGGGGRFGPIPFGETATANNRGNSVAAALGHQLDHPSQLGILRLFRNLSL